MRDERQPPGTEFVTFRQGVPRNDPTSRRFASYNAYRTPLFRPWHPRRSRTRLYLPAPETRRRYFRTTLRARRPLPIARHRCYRGTPQRAAALALTTYESLKSLASPRGIEPLFPP